MRAFFRMLGVEKRKASTVTEGRWGRKKKPFGFYFSQRLRTIEDGSHQRSLKSHQFHGFVCSHLI